MVRSKVSIGDGGSSTRRRVHYAGTVPRDTAIIGRRIRIAALSSAAVAVVALSWLVPEPDSTRPASTRPVDNVSYLQCAPQFAAAPNYGTRALGNACAR